MNKSNGEIVQGMGLLKQEGQYPFPRRAFRIFAIEDFVTDAICVVMKKNILSL